MSYYDYVMQHVRLALLRALAEAVEFTANDSILAMRMDELGLPVTRDQLRTQIGWLEEQGLIRVTRPTDSLIVACLRQRGADVALGRATVDGVQKPSPSL